MVRNKKYIFGMKFEKKNDTFSADHTIPHEIAIWECL